MKHVLVHLTDGRHAYLAPTAGSAEEELHSIIRSEPHGPAFVRAELPQLAGEERRELWVRSSAIATLELVDVDETPRDEQRVECEDCGEPNVPATWQDVKLCDACRDARRVAADDDRDVVDE